MTATALVRASLVEPGFCENPTGCRGAHWASSVGVQASGYGEYRRYSERPTVFVTPHWDQESQAVLAHPSVNLSLSATRDASVDGPGDFDAGLDLRPDQARIVARLLLETADRVDASGERTGDSMTAMAYRVDLLGRDGKNYPRKPITGDERQRLIAREHHLHHDGRSIRQIVTAVAAMGYRRSVGTVQADLTRWTCSVCRDSCSGGSFEPPEQDAETPPPVQVSQGGTPELSIIVDTYHPSWTVGVEASYGDHAGRDGFYEVRTHTVGNTQYIELDSDGDHLSGDAGLSRLSPTEARNLATVLMHAAGSVAVNPIVHAATGEALIKLQENS